MRWVQASSYCDRNLAYYAKGHPRRAIHGAGAPFASGIALPTRMTALVILKPFLDDLPRFDI